MTQGVASKEEAADMVKCFTEVFDALPKKKMLVLLWHANSIYLFLDAAIKALPSEGVEKG